MAVDSEAGTAPLRVLIVDDERIARDRLRTMLMDHQGVEVAAECRDGADAIEALESSAVDGVFLDIQMPELDGFEVVRTVGPHMMPPVVFTTAYEQFAVRAFEVRAVDYLLKPFDQARLADALARLRAQRAAGAPERAARLDVLLEAVDSRGPLRRLVVRRDGRMTVVRIEDVDYFEAADNYVRIRVGKAEHLVRGRISAMQSSLDSTQFARIHRSIIVNLDRVREVQPMFHGDCVVILGNGVKLPVSATYRVALLAALGTVI